jgi:Flp pilus assembly protein TadB
MTETLKKIFMIVALLGQVVGVMLLFINIWWAVLFYIVYGLAMLALVIVLIVERDKEKEEDDQNDYRDY